jgi:hypothetical protein
MSAVNLRDARFHVLLPVEGKIHIVCGEKDHFAGAGLVVRCDRYAQAADAVSDDKVSFFHDFELLNGDSLAFVTIQEFGFVPRARSNYRIACGRHAPKGVAARLRAGVGAACA